jgi:hypothetical protein
MVQDVSSDEEEDDYPVPQSASDSFGSPDLGSLLLDSGSSNMTLKALHPQPVHIFMLWQAFRDNIDPLTKLFHAPTVQQTILDASADLENVPRATEALMFSIYSSAVVSMTEADCQSKIGEARGTLLARFQTGAMQALRRAELLKTSDLVVLQAFILYLVSQIINIRINHHY